VYELAKEFGVESRLVMIRLVELREFVRSASSVVAPEIARQLREVTPSQWAEYRAAHPPRTEPEPVPVRRRTVQALTIPEAAACMGTDVETIEAWIAQGILIAVRPDADGRRYVDFQHLAEVERDVRVSGEASVAQPQPLPISALPRWLAAAGYPVTEAVIRHWIRSGTLVPRRPGGRGRGRAALFDPHDALVVAMTHRYRRPVQPARRRPAGDGAPPMLRAETVGADDTPGGTGNRT
jgi:DNA-binding transcriptional MerR regulator